jgi:hypothetical protein
MVKIWFEDINWTTKNGEIIPMSYGQEIISGGRLVSRYDQPTITNDTWMGKSFPVQITNYEAYSFQFSVKEMSIHNLAKLQSCKKIWIHEYETNEIIEVDTETDGKLLIEPGGNIGSVEQKIRLSFVTNRTPVYPGISRLNTNNLRIYYDSNYYNFYTDKAVMAYINDPALTQFEYGNGQLITAKSTIRKGKKMVFYLMEADAINLKELIAKSLPQNVSINPDITNEISTETGLCELTELTEGLYKCIVTLPTSNIVEYA